MKNMVDIKNNMENMEDMKSNLSIIKDTLEIKSRVKKTLMKNPMEILENNIDGLPVEMGLLREMAVWD